MANFKVDTIEMGVITFTREQVENLLMNEAKKLIGSNVAIDDRFTPQFISSGQNGETVYIHIKRTGPK